MASVSPIVAGSKPKKLLDQTRDVLRLKHYSLRTERSYCDWNDAGPKVSDEYLLNVVDTIDQGMAR